MNEEDIKNKLIVPFLNSIGIYEDELEYEHSFQLQLGKTIIDSKELKIGGRSDILVKYNNHNLFVFELKAEEIKITDSVKQQGLSYARLLNEIPPYTIISNGKETILLNSITGNEERNLDKNKTTSFDESIALRLDALKNIISYSTENINTFVDKINAVELNKVENKKYIKKLFVSRKDSHIKFNEFLESEDKIFVITGKSGSGKTNLICDLYYQFKESVIPLFYNSAFIEGSIVNKIKQTFNFGFSEQYEVRTILERLEQIAEKNKKLIIFYFDALDELKLDNPAIKFDEILQAIDSFKNIKLCVSCKTNFIERLNSINGITSEFEAAKKQIFNLNCFEEKEIQQLIYKYSTVYNVDVDKDINYKFNEIKDGFLFRLIFEANENGKIDKDTKIDDKSIIQSYLKKICMNNNWSQLDLNYVLTLISKIYLDANDHNNFYLNIDENQLYEELKSQKITLQDLYDKYIIEKNSISKDNNVIEFYYKPISYYCICLLSEKLDRKVGQELFVSLEKLDKNIRTREALSWYSKYFNSSQLPIVLEFKKCKGLKYYNEITNIINKNFPNLKDKFECNTDFNKLSIGLIENNLDFGDMSYFFYINDSKEKVKIFDYCPKFGEVNTGKTFTIYSSMLQLNAENYVMTKLVKIVENCELNEEQAKFILQEKIILSLITYFDIFDFPDIKKNSSFLLDYKKIKFPINIDKLNEKIENSIYNDYLFFKERKIINDMNFSNYLDDIINEKEKTPIILTNFNKVVSKLYYLFNKFKNLYDDNIEEFPYFIKYSDDVLKEDMNIIERQFSCMTNDDIKQFYEQLYRKIIEDYINVVENNFQGILNKLKLYSYIKKGLTLKIILYKNKEKKNKFNPFTISKKYIINDDGKLSIECLVKETKDPIEVLKREENEVLITNSLLIDLYDSRLNKLNDKILLKNSQYAIIRNEIYNYLLEDLKELI